MHVCMCARAGKQTLRMLGALLSHRKFSLVFLESNGVEQLLPLPDMPYYANAVAVCLSSLATFRGVRYPRTCLKL